MLQLNYVFGNEVVGGTASKPMLEELDKMIIIDNIKIYPIKLGELPYRIDLLAAICWKKEAACIHVLSLQRARVVANEILKVNKSSD